MNTAPLPSELYKANVELQQRVIDLLQKNGRNWIEILQQFSLGGVSDTAAQIGDRFRTADRQSLVTLSSEIFWPALQRQLNYAQAINQLALKNQISFATELQQSLRDWYHSVFEAFGSAVEAGDLFKQWGVPWTQAEAIGTSDSLGQPENRYPREQCRHHQRRFPSQT